MLGRLIETIVTMRMIESHGVGTWRVGGLVAALFLLGGMGCKPVDEAPRVEETALVGSAAEAVEAAEVGWLVDVTE